jgi:ATP-dependent exoDNAse (exonuclease V) beta subunit
VPQRPDNVQRPLGSVMPGLHEAEAGPHPLVWWDPAVLELGVKPSIGLSQTRILEADDADKAGAALAQWEAWRASRAATRDRASDPTHEVRAATEWAHAAGEVEGAAEVEVIEVKGAASRPRGPRFGTLVHALLATVGLDDDHDRVVAHAEVQARLLGATDAERDAAVDTVVNALVHPVLRRAAAADREGRCRRESAIVLRLEDGTLLESVADLAFEEDGGWTVVDFKTDAELEGRIAGYRRQVALYAHGIAEATGRPARGVLLGV